MTHRTAHAQWVRRFFGMRCNETSAVNTVVVDDFAVQGQ
jgi:hypothetical protein